MSATRGALACGLLIACTPTPASIAERTTAREAPRDAGTDTPDAAALDVFCKTLATHNPAAVTYAQRPHAECDQWPSLPEVSCVANLGLRVDAITVGANADTSCDSANCRVGVRATLIHAGTDGGAPAEA